MRTLGIGQLCILVISLTAGLRAQSRLDANSGSARLGSVPRISVLPSPASTPAGAEIDELIASLAEIDAPDIGFSGTLQGFDFAPLEDLSRIGVFTWTEHGLTRSKAFRKLVELGPLALPHLLRALDDKTPTRLVIKHEWFMGMMWFAQELDGNSAHPTEKRVLANWQDEDDFESMQTAGSYTVKVGDICFVAIGQIVGREYSAVRYQMTACIVINSPVERPKLARAVREIWSAGDARQALLDSLLIDYSVQRVDIPTRRETLVGPAANSRCGPPRGSSTTFRRKRHN